MSCPSCGADVPAGARFCPSCGQAVGVGSADERRIVTVLFGDLVGFTGLAEDRDPELVKNLVDTCFARVAADVESFGGQVDKVVGDAIVALFGAPVAHEDDAERAVRAALRIQDTVAAFAREREAPIRMRIGINSGEVLVGRFRADTDYTAMGDTVNIASRLQALAEPGTVLVGPDTEAATRASIRYEEVGHLDLRGRGTTVPAWRALEPIGLPGERRTRRATRLIGREAELALVRATLGRAVGRRRAHLLLVVGDGGVGKTRVAEEVAELAVLEHDALVLHGRCVPYGESNVWGPLADAVRTALGIDPDAEVSDDAFRGAVAELTGFRPDADEVLRIGEGLLHLLDVDGPLRRIDPARAQEEAGRAFRLFLQLVAARRPVVLWLTDLHWGSDVVRLMVDGVLARLARLPLLIVATARHELLDRWSPRSGRGTVVQLSLDPLDRGAAGALLDALLPAGVGDDVRLALLDRADGNPFYLEELAARVREGEDAAGGAVVLPDTVRGLVEARLDSLEPEERALLEDASVLGRQGSVRALTTMADRLHGWTDLDAMLRRLDERDLLRVEGGIWSFRSNLVHDVAYGRLTKSERARRHAGVAAFFEDRPLAAHFVEHIANHYRRAAALAADIGPVEGVPADVVERAIGWIQRAADELVGSLEGAVALVTSGLDLLAPEDTRRAGLLLRRAKIHTDRLDLAAARADVAEAARLSEPDPDPVLRAFIGMRLGEIEQRAGDYDRSIELLREAAAGFEALGELRGMAECHRQAGMSSVFAGRFDEAEVASRAALAAFEHSGERRGAAWARQNLAWVSFLRGDIRDAEDRIAEAMAAFGELGDRGGIAWSRGLLAYLRLAEGRFADAQAFAREELAEARERGDRWGEGILTMVLASVDLWEGRSDEAVRRAERAIATFRTMGEPLGHAQAAAVLGRALVRCGRPAASEPVFAEALAVAGAGSLQTVRTAALSAALELGDTSRAASLLEGAGPEVGAGLAGHQDRTVDRVVFGLQTGDLVGAREALESLAPMVAGDDCVGSTLAAGALVAAAEGDVDAVAAWAAAVAASRRATYTDLVQSDLARALAAARRGDLAAARRAIEDASGRLARTSDRLWPAITTLAAAEVSAGADDAAERRDAAERALAELGVGAEGWRRAFRLAATAPSRT